MTQGSSRPTPTIALLVAVSLALAGCAGSRPSLLVEAHAGPVDPAGIAARHKIFVATTRKKSEIEGEYFTGNRAPEVGYVSVDVTVPAIHQTGAMERPRRGAATDPAKHFAGESVNGYDNEKAWQAALRKSIAERGGRALVFVHGYNTRFDDAVYRLTQIVNDAGYAGAPVLFTWASAGRVVDYVYDQNSAHAARDALEETLRNVRAAGARRIDVIAHSMGTWVALEALRQLAMTGDRDIDGKLGDVVLASPDIDVDVFKSQMARYGRPDKPFFVLLSDDDRALRLSRLIAGNRPRLGGYEDAAEIAQYGVIVANLSGIKAGDSLNHTKFADNPVLVKLLGERLAADDLAEDSGSVEESVGQFARGIGQTITSAAEIVITTPVEVVKVAVGQ